MAHVGVKRLGAGDGQKHAAEHDEAHAAVGDEELQAGQRAQGLKNDPGVRDLHEPEQSVDGEEHHHDRPEKRRDARRAPALHKEQRDENHDRRREDIGREARIDLLQPFERREHRDRRRDDRVAREQSRAGDAEQEHRAGVLAERRAGERVERKDAAFALVVGLHQEHDIFGGDDDE